MDPSSLVKFSRGTWNWRSMFSLFSIIFHCSILDLHKKKVKIMSKTLPNCREFALLVPVSLNPTRWAGPARRASALSSWAALALREGAVLCPEEAEKPSPRPRISGFREPGWKAANAEHPRPQPSLDSWTLSQRGEAVGASGPVGKFLPARATAAQHSLPSHKACLCIPGSRTAGSPANTLLIA